MRKKIWAALIACFILVAGSAVVLAAEDDLEILPSVGGRIGDVNMDKDINIKDATLVQKYIAKLETLSDEQLILADADLDLDVNIKDATYIQKLVAGLVKPAFPTDPVPTVTQTPVTQETTCDEVTVATTGVIGATLPCTQPVTSIVTDPTEVPVVTDPTEATQETTAPALPTTTVADPTETITATDPAETTQQPTTRDPNKPIELPFIPAK